MQSGDHLARRMKLLDLHILMAVARCLMAERPFSMICDKR